MNRYIIILLIIGLSAYSCDRSTQDELPEKTLKELKTLKKMKRSEQRALDVEIAEIDSLIGVKDPESIQVDVHLVTVDTAKVVEFDRFLEVQSNVEADDELMVSSEIGGRIVSSYVKEGQRISRGALVAKLDMESVVKQKAEIGKSLELATQVYQKQKSLWDKKIGSEIQFLQAKNNKERLEKSLETIDFQLTKANVYAPMTGEVDMVFAESGETVGPGAPIIKILSTRNLKIVADVPEAYLRSVKRGDKVQVTIPTLEFEKELRVSRIGSTVNSANRTFKVEVNVSNPSEIIKPNLLAYMFINDYHAEDVITIPVNQIQQEVGGRQYVYIADVQNNQYIAKKVTVVIGESYDGMVVIDEGLEAGDLLIRSGSTTVPEGGILKIKN